MKWMLMPLRRYADFSGRSRRMEYWMWVLFNLIVALLLAVPLTIIIFKAFWAVEARGGVSYHSGYGSPDSGFSQPVTTPHVDPYGTQGSDSGTNAQQPRTDDPYGEDGSDATWRDDERSGENDGNLASGGGSNGEKVSSRGANSGDQPALLAMSYQVDVNPFMFFQEFGPIGWILFGLYTLWALITFIPNLAVAVRRLHDTDRSGWWLFIGLIPLIGFIMLLVFLFGEGTRGPNGFGPDPKAPARYPSYT